MKLVKVHMKMPRLNIYVCEHGCETIAVDVDKGFAPPTIRCRNIRAIFSSKTDSKGQCKGTAYTAHYPKDYAFDYIHKIKWELGIPSEKEIKEMIRDRPGAEKAIREYCDGTRLLLRPRNPKTPMLFHEKANDETSKKPSDNNGNEKGIENSTENSAPGSNESPST